MFSFFGVDLNCAACTIRQGLEITYSDKEVELLGRIRKCFIESFGVENLRPDSRLLVDALSRKPVNPFPDFDSFDGSYLRRATWLQEVDQPQDLLSLVTIFTDRIAKYQAARRQSEARSFHPNNPESLLLEELRVWCLVTFVSSNPSGSSVVDASLVVDPKKPVSILKRAGENTAVSAENPTHATSVEGRQRGHGEPAGWLELDPTEDQIARGAAFLAKLLEGMGTAGPAPAKTTHKLLAASLLGAGGGKSTNSGRSTVDGKGEGGCDRERVSETGGSRGCDGCRGGGYGVQEVWWPVSTGGQSRGASSSLAPLPTLLASLRSDLVRCVSRRVRKRAEACLGLRPLLRALSAHARHCVSAGRACLAFLLLAREVREVEAGSPQVELRGAGSKSHGDSACHDDDDDDDEEEEDDDDDEEDGTLAAFLDGSSAATGSLDVLLKQTVSRQAASRGLVGCTPLASVAAAMSSPPSSSLSSSSSPFRSSRSSVDNLESDGASCGVEGGALADPFHRALKCIHLRTRKRGGKNTRRDDVDGGIVGGSVGGNDGAEDDDTSTDVAAAEDVVVVIAAVDELVKSWSSAAAAPLPAPTSSSAIAAPAAPPTSSAEAAAASSAEGAAATEAVAVAVLSALSGLRRVALTAGFLEAALEATAPPPPPSPASAAAAAAAAATDCALAESDSEATHIAATADGNASAAASAAAAAAAAALPSGKCHPRGKSVKFALPPDVDSTELPSPRPLSPTELSSSPLQSQTPAVPSLSTTQPRVSSLGIAASSKLAGPESGKKPGKALRGVLAMVPTSNAPPTTELPLSLVLAVFAGALPRLRAHLKALYRAASSLNRRAGGGWHKHMGSAMTHLGHLGHHVAQAGELAVVAGRAIAALQDGMHSIGLSENGAGYDDDDDNNLGGDADNIDYSFSPEVGKSDGSGNNCNGVSTRGKSASCGYSHRGGSSADWISDVRGPGDVNRAITCEEEGQSGIREKAWPEYEENFTSGDDHDGVGGKDDGDGGGEDDAADEGKDYDDAEVEEDGGVEAVPGMSPPVPWVVRESRSVPGDFFFFNPATGESTWTLEDWRSSTRPDLVAVVENDLTTAATTEATTTEAVVTASTATCVANAITEASASASSSTATSPETTIFSGMAPKSQIAKEGLGPSQRAASFRHLKNRMASDLDVLLSLGY